MEESEMPGPLPTADADYWDSQYGGPARPGWDMNGPTPLVDELLQRALPKGLLPASRIAVPGCGMGHDAAHLAGLGFAVTGVDFSPRAIERARQRYGEGVDWRVENWFSSTAPPGNAVFDHTCFVALDPPLRPAMVNAHADHLVPGGLWLGVFFERVVKEPGPPFAIPAEEIRRLAEARFEVLDLAPALCSHEARAGRELLLVARLRG